MLVALCASYINVSIGARVYCYSGEKEMVTHVREKERRREGRERQRE